MAHALLMVGRMNHGVRFGMAVLCAGVAAMMALASALGVFARGDGAVEAATSIRGELFHYVTS